MEYSEYILFALLGLIAFLLIITITILLRRNSTHRISNHTPITKTVAEQANHQATTSEPEETQKPNDIEMCFKHLEEICPSISRLTDGEYILTFPDWSLPYTLQLASNARKYEDIEDQDPSLKLYLTVKEDNSWSITDRGDTATAVAQLGKEIQAEIEKLRKQITSQAIAVSEEGTLTTQGTSYEEFQKALHNMRETAKTIDTDWSDSVWENLGPMPSTLDQSTGQKLEFSGTGKKTERLDIKEKTRSFKLHKGAMAFQFEHKAETPTEKHIEGLYLVRDDPGMLDEPLALAENTITTGIAGTHLVTEGKWRDPHPDISYHLEVRTTAAWECTILQPELGQSKGQFPHRGGLSQGAIVMGPFRAGARPVRARIQHEGREEFSLQFSSLDGTHQTELFGGTGQFHIEDHETDLQPGKEYIACAYGSGAWEIELTEGY